MQERLGLRTLDRMAMALSLLATVNIAVVAAVYLLFPGHRDPAEASIASAAFRLLKGTPVYYGFDSPELVSMVYGPLNYAWVAWPMALFGGSIATAKIASLLASGLFLVLSALLGRRFGVGCGALALGLAAVQVMADLPYSLVIRPESLLLGLAALAAFITARAPKEGPAWEHTLMLGLLAGLVTNVKIHGLIYLAPLLVYHMGTDRPRLFTLAAATVGAFAAPFLLPVFPPEDYFIWFLRKAGIPNDLFAFRRMAPMILIYLLPFLAWGVAGCGRPKGRLLAALACYGILILLTLLPATKLGAGKHYFLPFLPATLFLTLPALAAARRIRAVRAAILAATLAMALGSLAIERRFFVWMNWPQAREVIADMEDAVAAYPGETVQMGVGGPWFEQFRLSFTRDHLVFAGQPYTLDFNTAMEMAQLGVPLPPALKERLASCHTRVWLVPKGEPPFRMQGYYLKFMFGPDFVELFDRTYQQVASLRQFDVWRCRKPLE